MQTFASESLLIVSVDRESIETGTIRPLVKLCRDLDRKQGRGARGSVHITFDGYNDTTDEIYEIPEICAWVKKAFQAVPHLLYYLEIPLGALHNFMFCKGETKFIFENERMTATEVLKSGLMPNQVPQHRLQTWFTKQEMEELLEPIWKHARHMNDHTAARDISTYVLKRFPLRK